MRNLILISFIFFSLNAIAARSNDTLIATNSFALISETAESQHRVGFSYPGIWNNSCGIILRIGGNLHIVAEKLNEAVIIKGFHKFTGEELKIESGEIVQGALVARITDDDNGLFIKEYLIKSRHGGSLKEAIQAINPENPPDVIVQIIKCDQPIE